MLAKITLLTSYLFAVLYPLSFWISYRNPLKNNFHRFHLGLPAIVAVIILIFAGLSPWTFSVKLTTGVWACSLFILSWFYWRKPFPAIGVVTFVCLLGIAGYIFLSRDILISDPSFIISTILGGLIFCGMLFAMNLGHWYLNVHGLEIKHLKNAVKHVIIILYARLLWDIVMIIKGQVLFNGEMMGVGRFLITMEGLLLLVGVLFGTILPLAGSYFALETVRLKNTQSTTGILYVLLCSLLLGDMTYKFFALKYGVYL